MKNRSIVLTGMAGVGKSTIGRILAKELGYRFIDLDHYIRHKDGRTVQQVIDDAGDEALLQLEKERMREICLKDVVVAPGGSIIYHHDLMTYLKENSTIVYLEDCFDNIARRLSKNQHRRGIVGLKSKSLKQIYEERKPLYPQYADITIHCAGKNTGQIVSEIIAHFRA